MPPQEERWAQILKQAERDHTRDRPNADRTLRTAATIADILLFLLCYSLLSKLISALEMARLSAELTAPTLKFCAFAVLAIFYFAVATWMVGGTIGKKLLGIRVTTADGSSPNLATCLLREIVCKYGLGAFSAGIIPVLFITGLRSQPLHDLWLGTTVKRVRGKL